MTMNDAPPPPPPERPASARRAMPRWLPIVLALLVLVALAFLASTCTDDDAARNQPTYQGAAPGSSPPASVPSVP